MKVNGVQLYSETITDMQTGQRAGFLDINSMIDTRYDNFSVSSA